MLSSKDIIKILQEGALKQKVFIDTDVLISLEGNNRYYALDEFAEFKRDLIEAGSKTKLLFLEYKVHENAIPELLSGNVMGLSFKKMDENIIPVLLTGTSRNNFEAISISAASKTELDSVPWFTDGDDQLILFVIFPYQNIVSEDADLPSGKPIKPVKRLFRLLSAERKQISYIIFYAILIGFISLILPLGIQTTIELISGGVFFSSVYVLITLVIIGVLVSGALQIVQISLVEHLQRRIFTKAAFEFAFRIPRLKIEALTNNHAPELVNRFFDIMTIQKGLPKLLIDLSSAIIQIFFGLLLLSLYHPFFVFFSLILVTVLVAIFYMTGPRGLESSLNESKYKYKVVFWFEELARTINSFKLAGNTDLPLRRTDYNVSNYLKYRKTHFTVLVTQFSFIIVFKGIVTGGLLIMGTVLVVSREITLGQFVASEIIIILILNAVEKLIMYMDVVYDLLTAVDKIGHITDLPLDKMGGIDFPSRTSVQGYALQIQNLKYKYASNSNYILNDVTLSINRGDRICITGSEASGKTTLTNIIAGLHYDYEGAVTIDNYSLRDLDLTHLRNRIAKNISPEDIFDGSILENISLGKTDRTVEDALQAIAKAGLQDKINVLPEGLNTHVVSGGKGLSSTMIHRLILARCMAKKPELIILNDFFSSLTKGDKLDLIQRVIDQENKWTVIVVSNDPLVMAACDRILVLHNGRVEAEGNYEDLIHNVQVSKYLE